MLRILLLAAFVAVALGGRSPNADYFDELVSSGARYSDNVLEDASLDVPDLVAKYGYPIEIHDVVTEDGYIVTMHRIPHGRDQNNKPGVRTVVFLMHGLLTSSASFVGLGPGNALAYILAEEGYDVWMGNARGNYYSRRHITLNPDRSRNYWRFSWDEIGNYDLPACFSHIESVTGQSRLHYIGHSQGATNALVLLSLRPEYNEKIISFQAMAPGAFFRYNRYLVFQLLAPLIDVIEPAAFAATRGEVLPNRQWITTVGNTFCHEEASFFPVCSLIFSGATSIYMNQTMIPILMGHTPAGSSIRQLTHYGQGVNRNSFRRYDFGFTTNLRVYGRRSPPDYNLSRVTARTNIHYSVNDDIAFWRDVELLSSRLPNANHNLVPSTQFDHFDFVTATGVKEMLYDRVISLMRAAETNV